MEHTGFFIESVRFVNQKRVHYVPAGFRVGAGTLEHIVDAALFDFSLEFHLVDIAGRTVLGDVLYKLFTVCQLGQQTDRNDTFAGAGPARADDGSLFMVLLTLFRDPDDFFKDDSLLIDHDEFFIAFDHRGNGVLETL